MNKPIVFVATVSKPRPTAITFVLLYMSISDSKLITPIDNIDIPGIPINNNGRLIIVYCIMDVSTLIP